MGFNDGKDLNCARCGKAGNTAHDMHWVEGIEGWLCETCSPTLVLTPQDIRRYTLWAVRDQKAKQVKSWRLFCHKDGSVSLQTILLMKDGSYYYHNTAL